MKLLIVLSTLLAASSADAFYGLGYPYAYAHGSVISSSPYVGAPGYIHGPVSAPAPTLNTLSLPVPVPVPAPVVPVVAPAAPAVIADAVPGVASSQFHSQDEAGNYAFGYDNINSARVESGNSATVVTGSYTDKDLGRTYNYVSDSL